MSANGLTGVLSRLLNVVIRSKQRRILCFVGRMTMIEIPAPGWASESEFADGFDTFRHEAVADVHR